MLRPTRYLSPQCCTLGTCFLLCLCFSYVPAQAADSRDSLPLFRTVDLNRGELANIVLSNGSMVQVKLLGVEETRDPLRSAVRQARVTIEINRKQLTLISGTYH